MQWLNPWAWLGALTLVLPVLVHLFSRRQARVEPFPTLRFLDASRLLPTRRTRLNDVPLLLLRLAILAAAVAALAQPRWGSGKGATSTTTLLIVDRHDVAGDSVAQQTFDQSLSPLLAPWDSATSPPRRISTARVGDALPGAVAWLATHDGARELVIASDFTGGALDSADLAALPRDITVRLVTRPSVTPRDTAPPRGVVWWATGRDARTTTASAFVPASRQRIRASVQSLGARILVDSVVPLASASTPVIVVVDATADSLVTWLREAQPLSAPWMARVVREVAADSALAVAARALVLRDTTIAAPHTVLGRTASRSPVVMAASLGSGASARLLLWTRAPYDGVATGALLLAASRALEPAPVAPNGERPDRAALARWERAPAAPPLGARRALSDRYDRAVTHARWLWVLVLLLLGAEYLVRRRTAEGADA